MKPLKNRFVQEGVVATLALVTPRTAHALAVALVQVANTSADPVPNKDVDSAGRHPFASSCSIADGNQECFLPAVPANTEYVIQTPTVVLQAGTTPAPQSLGEFQTTAGGTTATVANFPLVNSGGEFGSATESLTAYSDPGTTPLCVVQTPTFLPSSVLTCAITGYTVSLP
jgi:hypothetical protein